MTYKTRILAAISVLAGLSLRAADLPVTDGDRIIFGGDSIQDGGMWPHYVAAYLILRNPTMTLHCQTESRGGLALEGWLDPSGTSYSQYSRHVYAYEPDFFFISSSTNGSYSKARHTTAMTTLWEDYVSPQGATIIMHGTPPDSTATGNYICEYFDDAHAEMSVLYDPPLLYHQTWLSLRDRFTENETFTADSTTDVITAASHGFSDSQPVLFILSTSPVGPAGISKGVRYYVRDATTNTFKVSLTDGGSAVDILTNGAGTNLVSNVWPLVRRQDRQDDLHPGQSANICYAWKLITGLGWGTDVSTATIDGSAATLTSSTDCTVASIATNAYGGIDFTRLDDKLPWAIDEEGRDGAEFIYPSIVGWQDYSLTVTGLTSGTYDVYINGDVVASVTHTALAAGWNMADLTTGPVWSKCNEVLGKIRDMHDRSRTYPFVTLHTSGDRMGVEKYLGAVSTAYADGLRTTALIADADVQASLHRKLDTVTINTGTDVFTCTSHGYTNGIAVRLSSTGGIPAPLVADTSYYVVSKTTSTFKLAATYGGAAIDITTSGSGTVSTYRMNNIDDMDALIHEEAQPATLTFSLRRQGYAAGPAAYRTSTRRKGGGGTQP